MKTCKDKKKFGGNSIKRKNKNSKRGISYTKEYRKYKRKTIRQVKHKLLKNIPLTEDETKYLWYL